MNRRKFLSRAAGGAALLPVVGAHAAQNFGVPFQILGSVTAGAFASRTAQASVQVSTTNAMISSYFDANGNEAAQLPNLGTNGSNSIFAHTLIWLRDSLFGYSSKRVLFSAVDPNNATVHFDITLWPGNQPAVRVALNGRQGPGSTGLPYLVVRAMSNIGQMIVDSWVVDIDGWSGLTPMLLDIAMHGQFDQGMGLVVNQYLKGILPGNGYAKVKNVWFGYSSAQPPTVGLNNNNLKNTIPWGSTANLITGGPPQLAFTVGGNPLEEGTGAVGITFGGLAMETNFAGNQASTAAALYSPFSGRFLLPQLSPGARFGNIFNGVAPMPPIALFGGMVDLSDVGIDPTYFGSNFGTNAPTLVTPIGGIPEFLDLDTSFQRVPQTDTLIEDPNLTNFFGP